MDHLAPRCVFVGGTGRSGTNVTKAIYGAHPGVAVLPFEHRVNIDPDGIVDCYLGLRSTWSPFVASVKIARLERFLERVVKRRPVSFYFGRLVSWLDPAGRVLAPPPYYGWELREWFPAFEDRAHRLLTELRSVTYRGVWPGAMSAIRPTVAFSALSDDDLKRVFSEFVVGCTDDILERTGKRVFVEDNTWNHLFADSLAELAPGSVFVEVVRDPRDVVASLRTQRWAPRSLEDAVVFVDSLLTRQRMVLSRVPSARVLRVRLEDISNDLASTARHLAEFAGMGFDAGMAEVDVSRAHHGRWKVEMSASEGAFATRALQNWIEADGFET